MKPKSPLQELLELIRSNTSTNDEPDADIIIFYKYIDHLRKKNKENKDHQEANVQKG